jgi:urease accessory protein
MTECRSSAQTQTLIPLLRLFHLVSPALPLGAFAYSQGLEYAVQSEWISDELTARDWLEGLAQGAVATLDLPVLARLHRAWRSDDLQSVERWSAQLLAARESAELRAEERHIGRALARILTELGVVDAVHWNNERATWATLFSLAAVRWQIGELETLSGYLWAWCENQVLAAIKLVPLGQSAGQRVLRALSDAIPELVELALTIEDDAISISTPGQALACSLHETQYSRLFRS